MRLRWQGAEYRGRGRQTLWRGELGLTGNRFTRATAVNFLNHELALAETCPQVALAWRPVDEVASDASLDVSLRRMAGKWLQRRAG